ncbi:Protein of unknown function (DUF2480) [Saprospira grandis DSM 2844]|uniref:DUF2480 family protein n=1 Tax=Saprospira grandis DSM 2844 TaxID=694433 RepID=J0P210_9BACT|nr:DUF2480 family protein [Saprospira grandis]EJF53819.1 Protein of unknown function (DUF2480) [Saprospira grandis DSM 2844]
MKNQPLVNRVAQSSLINFNLEDYYPRAEILVFDIKDYLFKGLILREKDFRQALKEIDWSQYAGKNLRVYCSADAIVPTWAYQLVVSLAAPYALAVRFGSQEEFLAGHYQAVLGQLDLADFAGKPVVIKGCSDKPVPVAAYMEITRILQPVAKSIMFGEACSTVPIYKQKKKK